MFQKCKLKLAKALGTVCATTTVKEVKIKINVSVHDTEIGRQLLEKSCNFKKFNEHKTVQRKQTHFTKFVI